MNVENLFGVESLESVVDKEKAFLTDEEISRNRDYQIQLSKEPAEELLNRIRNVYQSVQERGYMTSEQQDELSNINYAMDYKARDLSKGHYKQTSEQIESIMSASKGLLNYMRGGL